MKHFLNKKTNQVHAYDNDEQAALFIDKDFEPCAAPIVITEDIAICSAIGELQELDSKTIRAIRELLIKLIALQSKAIKDAMAGDSLNILTDMELQAITERNKIKK